CWRKAAVLTGRHPERWRQDAAGNVVCRRFWAATAASAMNTITSFHSQRSASYFRQKTPRGESTVENCQILQTRVNRSKSDKAWVEKAEMQGFSCDIKFTVSYILSCFGHVFRIL
ncbi:hypothetical protein ZWY2020_028363, partial [Hordeum vulgare]